MARITQWSLVLALLVGAAAAWAQEGRIPLIGEDAPVFTANSTNGTINFPADYTGKWVIVFSHPGDFTPVCTTEFMTFAKMAPEFKALNCELLGVSVDSVTAHIAWLRTIATLKWKDMSNMKVPFPVVADVGMDVANKFGMISPTASDTMPVRAVFFIDPKAKIRAIIYYPAAVGRNLQEIKRALIALQVTDAQNCGTPADWQPGDDVVLHFPGSCGAAETRVQNAGKDYYCLDWFLCFRKLSLDDLKFPPEAKVGPAK
jgi:peroxiredoxin (alkyl hydroperoxide reductase subunit C)